MLALRSFIRQPGISSRFSQIRSVSTLEGHPHIYTFPSNGSHILTLLPTTPPNATLSIGLTSKLPPTPDSFRENPRFLNILQDVLAEHGYQDPDAVSQAQVMVSTAGANLSSGGVLLTGGRARRRRGETADSSGGASGQGGAGPEDIFGSLEVDGNGSFVGGNGNYQASGTYRIITRDGFFGLSPFLREKLVQKLREIESQS
ncbi:hypothetical protein N8T08_007535 [Aspergillus melleus]|uniref:Uncharacterized protein n=1 Tax=Aspergillus melleus TaxID=138277 RepID=A0ACC3AX85_9EURO|nr:hypothetical protein N8T08_007535 [Aspergillus melleus]